MQVIAGTSSRTPCKADYSPFYEFFSFCGVIRGQMSIQCFKAVRMPYNDTSSISTFSPCESNRTRSGSIDGGGQFHCHIDSRMESVFFRYGMNPAAILAADTELVFQGAGQREFVRHSVLGKYVPVVFQTLQTFTLPECHIKQFLSAIMPGERKREKQYEHKRSHRAILLNILSASSSVSCCFLFLNTSSASKSDLFFSLYRKCRPPFFS